MVTQSSYRPQALVASVETDRFEFPLPRQQLNSDCPLNRMTLTKVARDLCLYGIIQICVSDHG
jgi:hypothetical protein